MLWLLASLATILTRSSGQIATAASLGPHPTYEEFIVAYKRPAREWDPTSQEYLSRKKIYEKNLADLESSDCPTCGVTGLLDLTAEEFAQIKGLSPYPREYIIEGTPTRFAHGVRLGLPYRIDWRNRNVVTSVKEQGNCGTCWSFATVAMCESSLILQGRASASIDLSEQYLLDCTLRSSCEGGSLYYAAMTAVRGLPSESDWPYQAKKSGRQCDSAWNKVWPALDFEFYTNLDDSQIKQLLVEGPVAVAVSASSWKNYRRGVHSCDEKEKLDHAVLLVGYDENGWILKNQWGQGWGEEGYIRVAYGSQDCRLGSEVVSLSSHHLHFFLGLLFLASLQLL